MQKWIIIGIIILIIICTGIIFFNVKIETEYIPEEEISSLDLRKTMIKLYYKNKENQEIQEEQRLIDSKELLKDPYYKLVQFLIDGPESDELQRVIPENVKILDAKLEKETLTIKFNKEVLINEEISSDVVDSITKTLTQLNEIQNVVIEVENNNEEEKNENNINNEITDKLAYIML